LVHLFSLIQSINFKRKTVLVENVLISFPSFVLMQAVILSLWTYKPNAPSMIKLGADATIRIRINLR
jgi:hypothetical protein